MTKHLTEQEVLDAIPGTGGILTAIATKLGVHRTTLTRWKDKSPKVAEAIESEKDETLDRAESELFKAIRNGAAWAVKFYLQTQGKSRGYTQKMEVDGNVKQTGNVHLYLPDNGRPNSTDGDSD